MMERFGAFLMATLLLCASSLAIIAQNLPDWGFIRNQNIHVYGSSITELPFPFVGGMNAVRFSAIDLDGDGYDDWVCFEKHGDRILPFLVQYQDDSVECVFAPQYASSFPHLHNWAIFKDYNGDGKADIFTYGLAGITVYKNVTTNESIRFELVTEQLESFYYSGYANLFTSPDDYLAIEDLDGDGDLDILNFWLLGKYVHYHRNYSMENYGDAEHFDFRLEQECWGHFEEGADDNSIVLNSACGASTKEPMRHIGSTLFVQDFTGNDLPDLLVGDVDYPNLILLKNGGNEGDARMVAMDTLFPSGEPVWLFSMPVVSMLDVDGDGDGELLASPSDPSLTKSQDLNSVWLYRKNMVTNEFEKVSESFLQDKMIDVGSGAYPVFYDWNGDGLTDLFIANYGSFDSAAYVHGFLTSYFSSSIAYYENIGTQSMPAFRLVTNDFANLKDSAYLALYPAFGDVDGDGHCDMLCGCSEGTLLYFANDAAGGFLPAVALTDLNVGAYSTPQLFDLDQDGELDLLVGNRRGQIAYYQKNYSTTEYQLVTEMLGNVDTRNEDVSYFGYAVPVFFRQAGETYLFCGNEQGDILYYKEIDNNLGGTFRCEGILRETVGTHHFDLHEGVRVAPAVADLNNDGFPDLMVGNYAGGVSYFSGAEPILHLDELTDALPPVAVYPNPAHYICRVEAENMQSLSLFDLTGKCVLTENLSNVNGFNLNISSLPSGLYLGTVRCPARVLRFKLVVQ